VPVPPLAESGWVYAAPTVPLGRKVVVTLNCDGAMVMLNACDAVAFELSFTCTVKLEVPAEVGVPLIAPLAASDKPAGSDPTVVDHVFPPDPPLAARVCEYAAPTVPLGSDEVVTVNCGGAMVMLRACDAVAFELSFTWTVKLEVPAVVGVPLIAPLAASDSPAGSEPVVVDHA
jgi:predicted RecA/RadA family phage recombinase